MKTYTKENFESNSIKDILDMGGNLEENEIKFMINYYVNIYHEIFNLSGYYKNSKPILPAYTHNPIKWLGYYGSNRNVLQQNYNLLILESDNILNLTEQEKQNKKCVGYLNITEVNSSRWFYPLVEDKPWILEENETWGSLRVDPRSEEWQNLLLNTISAKIVENNYDGFFFDSVDNGEYLEQIDPIKYKGTTQAVADIIKSLKLNIQT